MRSWILLAVVAFLALPTITKAQGGIGTKPRDDLYMVGAVVRDSLGEEVFARIQDFRRYADANNVDSAGSITIFNGGASAEGKWARPINLQNAEERARVEALIAKLTKVSKEFPEMKREHYAIFKDKDNPAGQKHFYQIIFSSGKKTKKVSFTAYPVEDRMLIGDIY